MCIELLERFLAERSRSSLRFAEMLLPPADGGRFPPVESVILRRSKRLPLHVNRISVQESQEE